MKNRIIGIDVARALAVCGMIIVNFKVVLGDKGAGWTKSFAQFFEGKAAATFVVLAGIGLALMTNSAVKNQDQERLKVNFNRIYKRAIFLFLVGLSWIWIWPADILHFYGVYMLLTLFLIKRSPLQLLLVTAATILIYPFLFIWLDYEAAWDFSTFEYADFWTLGGFSRNLFFNGFHPVIPWIAFMIFGLWYGRQDLRDPRFLKRSFWVGLGAFMGIQLVSNRLIHFFSMEAPGSRKDIIDLLGTQPMPPMPVYMINGISISVVIISAAILLASRYENNFFIDTLNKTGQLALTFYAGHVILGMGLIKVIHPGQLGTFSVSFSVAYAVIFSLLCMLFARIWLRFKGAGPLEWVMRKITD